MEIILNIKDRLAILSFLPSIGSMAELLDIIDIAKNITLTPEESSYCEYSNNGSNGVSWNPSKDIEKSFSFTLNQINLLKVLVKKLDSDKKVTIQILDTCLKINKL